MKVKLKRQKWKFVLLMLLAIIIVKYTLEFDIKFENDGNTLSLIHFKIKPIDYVYERIYKKGNLICIGKRRKYKIHMCYFNNKGQLEAEEKGTFNEYPIVRTIYWSKGKKVKLLPLVDSLKHGVEKVFDNNDKLVTTSLFKHGQLILEDTKLDTDRFITPYLEVTKDTNSNILEIYFDLAHIDFDELDSITLYYDFSKTPLITYPRPKSKLKFEKPKEKIKIEYSPIYEDTMFLYGYLQKNTTYYPAFDKNINQIIINTKKIAASNK